MQYIEPTDIHFLSVAEDGLIDESVIDPFVIESNFGFTHFLGVGKAPKEVLSYTSGLLKQFSAEKWRKQSTQIIRVETKMCSNGVHLIEIEQRPCGLGVFMEACRRFSMSVNIKIALQEITVLHSPGRVKEGVFFSDEHLFTDNIFPWEMPRDVHHLVIRSREDEKVPHWLNSIFYGATPPKMFLLRRNADKVAVYRNLNIPHRVLPGYPEDENIVFTEHVKQTLLNTLQDFGCQRCVIKPRRGSRAREVATFSPTEIQSLTKRSRVVKNLRRYRDNYIIQPYHRGIHEEKNVCHLYRIFYRKTERGWHPIGGFAALDNLKESGMIVHGHERVKNILIVP